jgi:hypothetical protein
MSFLCPLAVTQIMLSFLNGATKTDHSRPYQSVWNNNDRFECGWSNCVSYGKVWEALSCFLWSVMAYGSVFAS